MQPETPQPPFGQEQVPVTPTPTGERVPSLPPVDTGIERGADRREQAAEAGAAVADAIGGASTVAVPISPPTVNPVVAPPPTQVANNPLVAADEDLIEKEWVDKAKEIIQQTRDDPHKRTERVNELQRDYLQKRYGKIIGATE